MTCASAWSPTWACMYQGWLCGRVQKQARVPVTAIHVGCTSPGQPPVERAEWQAMASSFRRETGVRNSSTTCSASSPSASSPSRESDCSPSASDCPEGPSSLVPAAESSSRADVVRRRDGVPAPAASTCIPHSTDHVHGNGSCTLTWMAPDPEGAHTAGTCRSGPWSHAHPGPASPVAASWGVPEHVSMSPSQPLTNSCPTH